MKKRKNARLIILLLMLLFIVSFFLYALNRVGMFKRNIFTDELSASALLFNVDPLLIEAVMKRESNLNPDAVSGRGAVGLMQVMPDTAKEIAEQIVFEDYDDSKLKDPSVNIMFGTFYLSKLLTYYNYNLILALSAYNAGIGNVDKWLAKDPKISAKVSRIPFRETKRHVRAVIITYNFYKGAEQLKTLLKIKKK
ncbi:MAG: lytic transglycosylase domain-containing protein [Endomicrobium sp.]|jgi:soluble lytic murein transglycosylase|nr:lytic transglycosylase domain-containing protein [Endomicrobium sp.]